MDRALAGLLQSFLDDDGGKTRTSRTRGGVALVALGSYAQNALCPQSDIDLLLLHDGWGGGDLEALVQHVCYPLWDAGLSVGHAVRTTKEAVAAAGDRVDSATALTERRLVAGSQGMADDLGARVARWLRRSGGSLATDIARADAERHQRYGGSAGALEPELKDGIGGLRDLHSLRWAGAILLGTPGLDPLVGARYLGAADRGELAEAGETLLAVRCGLHMVSGRGAHNVLRLDLQDEVAELLGIGDGDDLLRSVGLATRTISHLHARTWPILLADATKGRRRRPPPPEVVAEGLVITDGLIELASDADQMRDAVQAFPAAAIAATRRTVIGRRSAVRLRQAVRRAGSIDWDDQARRSLMTLLRAGPDGIPAMADADYLGVMEAYLPEWDRVRGRPQRNPLHTFDLDTHAMQASAWLTRIVAGDIDPAHAVIHAEMDDPDALLLGTWLHDVGKAWPGDHSVAGEAVGRDWMLHMGFSAERADRVARLIRHHLLLPEIATQRDIDDPDEIEAVAVTIGDAELLDGLFLLSFADARATGKAAWSAWKDLLVTRLYGRVRAVLEGDVGILARPQTPEVVIRAAARMGVDEAELRVTAAGLPSRYLRVASAQQLAAHARLLHQPSDGLRVDRRDGPVADSHVLSVVRPDRVGIVSDFLGVLATQRIDVLEARVFTHSDGTALDWFVVTAPADTDWPAVVGGLEAAFRRDIDVQEGIERRERHRDARPPVLASPVLVRIGVHPYAETYSEGRSLPVTRIEVRGPDSPGALFRLTRALSHMGINLLGARIATLGPEVRDALFVVGDLPPTAQLEQSLEAALLDSPALAAASPV